MAERGGDTGIESLHPSSPSPIPTGLPKDIFLGEIEPVYLCCLCRLVLNEPFQGKCGHRFCQGCLENLGTCKLQCPACIAEEEEKPAHLVTYPDHAIKRELALKPAKCLEVGCSWRDSFKKYRSHVDTCHGQTVSNNMPSGVFSAHDVETLDGHQIRTDDSGIESVQSLVEGLHHVTPNAPSGSQAFMIYIGKKYRICNTQLFKKKVDKTRPEQKLNRELLDADEKRRRSHHLKPSISNICAEDMFSRIQRLETASYDGIMTWRIPDFSEKRREASTGQKPKIYCPVFFTGKRDSCNKGYMMRACIYLNGKGKHQGTYMSIYFFLMMGKFDALLEWPFCMQVTFKVLDQDKRKDFMKTLMPSPENTSFSRPDSNMNTPIGFPMFMPLRFFDSPRSGYVKDDVVFVEIEVRDVNTGITI